MEIYNLFIEEKSQKILIQYRSTVKALCVYGIHYVIVHEHEIRRENLLKNIKCLYC
jgi:hypothetical protein